MAYHFASDKIIVLLGAGASVDAGIPHSNKMIERIQEKLNNSWSDYKELYYYIKSLIYSTQAAKGDVNFNIESLVAVLNELVKIKNKSHGIYGFVGSWEKDMPSAVGTNFENVVKLKELILRELRDKWIPLADKSTSSYYKEMVSFAEELEQPLRVFSLNYDLCIEENCKGPGQRVERGFTDERFWDYTRFQTKELEISPTIYLYKLHGSIDWMRREDGRLTYSDSTSGIETNQLEIIFGLQHKMQSYDPYLFSLYEFREYCLGADVILVAGYGFADDHVNRIITQALTSKEGKKMVVNTILGNWTEARYKSFVREALHLSSGVVAVDDNNIIVENMTSAQFFTTKISKKYFQGFYDTSNSNGDFLE
ncbi:SIR2 family protein [Hymenobacter psoromatis]|uniref:SIR2 family protein n=1 Tax=Hymenobacter psoromatis TaxID=1484116 RepID=UPI001CBBBC25|nr:SIR2 family protein [Hymenobacter psoromatis]